MISLDKVMNDKYYLFFVGIFNFNREEIKKLIFKQSVKISHNLMIVGGLPSSGKSTLVRNMLQIEHTGKGDICKLPGLAVTEAAVMINPYSSSKHVPPWLSAITKEDAELLMFAACLTQVCAKRSESLMCSLNESVPAEQVTKFKLHIVNEYFERAFQRLNNLCGKLEVEGNLHFLQHASLVFMNIWDIGVNLAVFQVMSLLCRRCNGLILLDVLDLHQDAVALDKRLDLQNNDRYQGRYSARKDDQRVMQIHRAGTYYIRFVSVCNPVPNTCLLIGTHRDCFESDNKKLTNTSANIKDVVEDKVTEFGFAKVLHPQMLAVDTRSDKDARKVCSTVEKMIMEDNRFEKTVPLTWIMLRGVLQATERLFVQKSELWLYANECGLQNPDELNSWLDLFQSCMSIIYSPDETLASLHHNIIIRPFKFVQCVDRLYYAEFDAEIQSNPELGMHLDLIQKGILTYSFARVVWPDDSASCSSPNNKCNFMLKVLADLKISSKLNLEIFHDSEEMPPVLSTEQLYFVPSLRLYTNHTHLSSQSNSLVIMASHVHYAPFDICSEFLSFVQQQEIAKSLKYVLNDNHNVIHFKWRETPILEADIYFKLLDLEDLIEVSVCTSEKLHIPEQHNLALKQKVCSKMKTICIEFFHIKSQIMTTMSYKLCVVSPSCPSDDSQVHLVPFENHKLNNLMCFTCGQPLSSSQFCEQRTLWITSAYQVWYNSFIIQQKG